jgi:hypothetical protein
MNYFHKFLSILINTSGPFFESLCRPQGQYGILCSSPQLRQVLPQLAYLPSPAS